MSFLTIRAARLIPYRTYETERAIRGNNCTKISVSVFCLSHYAPFQPISGVQQGNIREKRAGSHESGTSHFRF
jgi:hypothetical protein